MTASSIPNASRVSEITRVVGVEMPKIRSLASAISVISLVTTEDNLYNFSRSK